MEIITLTTDFGLGSPYIAEMKGAILSINSSIQIVDATHSIAPQDIRQGALAIRQYSQLFPAATVHIAVVDPGVGTDRAILLVSSGDQFFIAPDNGLLTFQLESASDIRCIDQRSFWRSDVSATFHGRDIMSPVAANLCNGVSREEMSSQFTSNPVRLLIPEAVLTAERIDGQVASIDAFGNLITNISREAIAKFGSELRIEVGSRSVNLRETYSDCKPGKVVALIGSGGWLEIAVCGGNAHETLGTTVGEAIRVTSAP